MNTCLTRIPQTLALAALALAPINAAITYDGFASWDRNSDPGSFNASGSDKLVVVVSGEHNFGGNYTGNVTGITYNGQTLIKAVEESPSDPATGGHGQTTSDIWYLDNPGSFAGPGTIDVSFNGNNWVVTAIGLSGTEDGVGATAHVSGAASVNLATTAANSLVIANIGMGGQGNTADANVLPNAPLTKISGLKIGSNWASHTVGYAPIAAPGPQTFSFNTTKTDVVTIAAEFTSPSLDVPTNPSPAYGTVVPGGQVALTWTNLAPTTGTDVWVDVWFGADAGALAQVVDGAQNTASATVSAPLGGTYYWRVDSHLDGDPNGAPVTGSLFHFVVVDADNDGMPDAYELLHTAPSSPTALNPGDDLEHGGDGDGLTNLEEYHLGTDPNNPDSDNDTLEDGPELAGVGLRPPTNPLDNDSDDDGLKDGAESNTGTWTSTADTGTNPMLVDSDRDGLADGVETNTGTFVSATNTGTNPTVRDSDADGAEDWYEVVASFTDPTKAGDKPNIPYPLPDPDGSSGAPGKRVKVYILSGQSNMVGYGRVDGAEAATLQTISKGEGKFPNLVDDASGNWSSRNDVLYRGVIAATGNAPLRPGFASNSNSFGPELGFGHVMGWYHDEPVLIIKSSQGGRALGWDFLPPGSTQFTASGTTYAGYGDSPGSWPEGTTPVPTQYYGGYQYDQCFLDEADWAPPTGTPFAPVFSVPDILDNFASEYPDWAAQGFEIAGFVWWQGWNDGLSYTAAYANRYGQNMARFIRKLREYYQGRYPDHISPNAPFVLATAAFDGFSTAYPTRVAVANAQLAVGDPVKYPEFAGNVKTMEARGYWRDSGPNMSQNYHYYNNAETYMLTGDALGRGMIELLGGSGGDYATWAGNWPAADLTDPGADLDGDGLTNDEERIWGLDPTSSSSLKPISVPLNGDGIFSYTRRATTLTGLSYSYQWSTTLAADSWQVFTPELEDADGASPVETVEVKVGAALWNNPRLFVRVAAN